MINRFVPISTLMVICFMILYGCLQQDETIARIGNVDIKRSEYVSLLKRHFSKKNNYHEISLKQKKDILENLIIKKLKLNAAYDHKLDKETEFVEAVERYRRSLIQKRYYEKIVMDRIVQEHEIDTYLENQRIEVAASHILISFIGLNSKVQRSKDDALTLVEEILERLSKGEDFSTLADTYSDDPTVKHNHGSLGSFTWGQMVAPFQEALWSMEVGEIHGPVETQFGYHIIRLEDRRERQDYNLSTNEEALFEIKQKIYSSRADSGKALWNRHLTQLKDDSDFRIHTTALNEIAIRFSEQIYDGEISYDSFTADMREKALASWQGGAFTLEELIAPHRERLSRYVVRLKQIHVLKREVEDQAVNGLILSDARERGIDEDDFVTRYTELMQQDRLIQLVETRQVSDQINLTEDEAYQYYIENPKKFEKPAEIELWEIFVSDETKALDIFKMAQSGSNFEQLARKYSEDRQYANKGGYLGFRRSGTRGAVTLNAFENGSGIIGGPVKYRNGWTVFKTGKIKAASVRPFEEVKNRAKSLLRREQMATKRREWEQNLRNLYTIDIDEELLSQV